MGDEIKLTPAEVARVQSVLNDAFQEMDEVASDIQNNGTNLHIAYQGSGLARGVENYENLGWNGHALARVLEGLSEDLGVTITAGENTDAEAQAALSRAGGGMDKPAMDHDISRAI